MASMHLPKPPKVTEVGTIQPSPQGKREPKHQQLTSLTRADWLEGLQGHMSQADMLTVAGFGVDTEQESLLP
eukprot:4763044-Karenia_brevis.AAC.1